MDRRESLKYIAWSTISASLILDACKQKDKIKVESEITQSSIDRMAEEKAHEEALRKETFFTADEMATLGVLSDIIIPADDVSGSASEAKVPDFIEFMVKDKPELQIPMRGGLRWMDMQMLKRTGKSFRHASDAQRIALVDEVAYPEKAKPEMMPGVHFFNLMRNLTASGFYTTEMGIKDIGYIGNTPTQWNGVPDDVLKQYGISYTEKELRECVAFEKK
jgi:hypothetical protein